jgi:hypothetical protein
MGMFDSFYDANGDEWQTKAFACLLERWEIGDAVVGQSIDFQVKVFGGPRLERSEDALATIRGGRLVAVPDERDESLALMDYHGGFLATPAPRSTGDAP